MKNRGIRDTIMVHRYVLCLFLVISFSEVTASSQELPSVSLNVGECTLILEVNEKWNTMRLRAHHPNSKACDIDKGSMASVLSLALSKPGSLKSSDGYSLLSLGR